MKPARVTLDIQQLKEADAATLRRLWVEARDAPPPKTFTARLMRSVLAWDVQAAGSGGETAKVRRGWNMIINQRAKRRSLSSAGNPSVSIARDGTRILKEWGGTTHEVQITANGGATWNGQSYSSLSAVARAMTGTNRNGPKFFGLREGTRT